MQLIAIILPALALAPTGVLAWTKDSTGRWVANNNWYGGFPGYSRVHESCTKMNAKESHEGEYCGYWTNPHGGKFRGYCIKNSKNELECQHKCPKPLSPCQLLGDDGFCKIGYSACLEKMGCSNGAGGADCIGRSLGCASACG